MTLERLRHSVRTLTRNKRFAVLAILSLAIAIALNTTMYSVLDALIRPNLAIHEPERLVIGGYFGDWRKFIPQNEKNEAIRALSFHEAAAGSQGSWGNDLIERGGTVRDAKVLAITPNYFAVLGVVPRGGRLIAEGDADTDPSPIVVSERMWKQLFPGRSDFDTATVLLNSKPRVVVGLLPYEADFPGRYTDVWELAPSGQRAEMPLTLFRLRPEATLEMARAELHTLTLRFAQRTNEYPPFYGFNVQHALTRQFVHWGFHIAMIGAVFAVLLIACANLANLQLARGVSRTKELATRTAIGATRGDIIRQLVLESSWLALGGLVLGAVLTAWGMHVVATSVPDTLAEYVTKPQMSWRVLGVSVASTFVCLVLVGLLPAIKLSRIDVNELLKSGNGTGRSRSARQQYGVLVVAEVALALTLVAGASLLMRAALRLHEDVSHDEKQLVGAFIGVRPSGTEDRRSLRHWSDIIANRIRDEGHFVNAATSHWRLPAGRAVSADDPGGAPFVRNAATWTYLVVSPDYLRTMKLPVTRGRDFTPGEFAQPVVIVDQFTARELWKGRDPVGQLIKLGTPQSREPWLRVVGVAHVTQRPRNMSSAQAAELAATASFLGQVFVLNALDTAAIPQPGAGQQRSILFDVHARGTEDPRRLTLYMKRALSALEPEVGAYRIQRWDSGWIVWQRERHDFVASLFTVFAAVALILAALGVYAVISHTVAQRTREFGVRIAVGADDKEIERLVLHDGSMLTLLGIAAGLLITVWSTKFLQAFLSSEYDRYDPFLFGIVSLGLFLVAWSASYIPARRATRINPVEALRND